MSEFKVGAEVAIFYNGRLLRYDKIHKIYKNGNFVLVNDEHPRTQYTVSCNTAFATSTGHPWSHEVLRVATPELRAKLTAEEIQRIRDWEAGKQMDALRYKKGFTTEEAEAIAAMYKRLKGSRK